VAAGAPRGAGARVAHIGHTLMATRVLRRCSVGRSGGAVKAARITQLLSDQEWIEALRKAQGSQYRPAR